MIHTAKDRPQQRYSSIKVCSTLCISPAAGDERKAPSTNYKIYCDNYNVLNIRNKWLFKKNTVFKIHFIYILLNGVSLSHSVQHSSTSPTLLIQSIDEDSLKMLAGPNFACNYHLLESSSLLLARSFPVNRLKAFHMSSCRRSLIHVYRSVMAIETKYRTNQSTKC